MALNSKRLTKHFPNLTARDRFRLMMAARQRGDETEERRLSSSSPRKSFSVETHRGYSEALMEVMGCHVMFQLEIGVQIWKCQGLMDGATEKERLIAMTSLRLLAGLFLLRHQAWQMLCKEYGCDGQHILSAHPASETLGDLQKTATAYAFSREDAKAILAGDGVVDVISVEDLYEDMKAAVEERAKWWT